MSGRVSEPRVGIPKGRLFDAVAAELQRAGFPLDVSPRNYHPRCPGLTAFILKPRSVPQMVALGLLDLGFCGRDLVVESGYDDRLEVLADLGIQPVRMMAAAARADMIESPPRKPVVIATEFPAIADKWATGHNLAHICINTWGSTEAWAPAYADIVVDVVETGDTLRANGLVVIEELMRSTTVLIGRAGAPELRGHPLALSLGRRDT